MIGFFDSGFGGLTVLKEVVKALPQYSYIYLSDNARAPYGGRSQEVIFQLTLGGVTKLFDMGAEIVILACNTASSGALRRIQQEVLPAAAPQKRVLGIIIPTAEEVNKSTKNKKVGVLATEATVRSLAYPKEINKLYPRIAIFQKPCPLLVPIIEAGEIQWRGLDLAIKKYLEALLGREKLIDSIILGCTHFGIIQDKISRHLPEGIKIISQGPIVAEKLADYLARHSEIAARLETRGQRLFFTTENSPRVKELSELFYQSPVEIQFTSLP